MRRTVGTRVSPGRAHWGEALKLIPKPLPAGMSFHVTAGAQDLVLDLKTGAKETDGEFYPFDPEQIQNAADQIVEPSADGLRLRIKRAPEMATMPATMHGLMKMSDKLAYDVIGPVTAGDIPPVAGATASAPATGGPNGFSPAPGSTASGLTVLPAIGLAFLGGIILNLMPCVFPVLFLKGLALVQASGEERKRLRGHGLVYTLGILVSFWVVVGVLLALRSGGSKIGWGFQLQSPVFIAVLACGLFFFALSLAGQFDLGLSLTGVGGDLAKKQGYAGSFFTGVLATVVATPCTAPLMGAAIGFALAASSAVAFAVFTALGLGLAAPYLLLSFNPAWTRLLPRPGAWMEVLKQLTSVLLFGTVIWLAWVYGRLFSGPGGEGADHIAHLLGAFLILAIAGWALGRWPLRWGSTLAAVVLAVLALTLTLTKPVKDTLDWKPYSQASLDAARKAGHPVFIDFTAAWCLSCQVNEKAVLKSKDVEHELARRDMTLLKADWTQYDPEITRELTSLNRSGVPTYVIYPAAATAKPDVLPELLTKSLVLDAIERDASK